jgi:hypothetical protein
LPDVSERIRAEPTRSRSKASPTSSRARALLRALKPRSKRSLAGAALGAMMIGIVVNAVALQHGRRVAPALDPAPTAAVRAPQVAAAPAAARPDAQARPEPPRPSPSPVSVALAHSPKSADPIADFLRNQGADKRRLTLTAQGALAKLGFGVKATGALDADTRDALAEFAKAHHLPVSAEITPKLVKTLTAAAAAE